MIHFHDTIDSKGIYEEDTRRQDEVILDIFKNNPKELMTPFDVLRYFDKTPITSIRRGMTNLTKMGKLVKTNVQKKGEYGKMNYCWKLKTGQLILL